MKKFLKWALLTLGFLIVIAFVCFLYLIPPFKLVPPEGFIKPQADAYPALDRMSDPSQRLIAERGKYLVQTIGCTGCHTPGGDKGPKFETDFLAGGMKFIDPASGVSVSRNLTPDPATGLARRTDAQVLRTLRTGVFAEDGRVFSPIVMPWAGFSHLTEEDRFAIVTFLRQLKPVSHKIPDHVSHTEGTVYEVYGQDYSIPEGSK